MLGDSEVLRKALAKDVRHIYSRGSGALRNSAALPALTQLAEALNKPASGDASSRRLVYALVRETIRHIAKDKKEHAGIVALLGLHRGSSPKVGDRQERAAPYLGYKNAESFRKTKLVSKQSSTERKVIDILLDRIANALVIRALDAGLVMPPIPPPPPPPPTARNRRASTKPRSHTDAYLGPLGHANGAIASEVRAVFADGMKHTIERGKLPLLANTADSTYGKHGTQRDRVEALLTWAIASCDVAGWNEKPALFALAGLDAKRQLNRDTRLRRACKRAFPTQDYDATYLTDIIEAGIAVQLSEPLWEQATEVGVPCGPCVEEMHAKGALVSVPDPAVHRFLSNWLSVSLDYVEIDSRHNVTFHPPPIAH